MVVINLGIKKQYAGEFLNVPNGLLWWEVHKQNHVHAYDILFPRSAQNVSDNSTRLDLIKVKVKWSRYAP
jgi:hypothetical protein